MLNFTFIFVHRKYLLVVFSFVVVFGIIPQVAVSQEITHTFKITGDTRIPVYLKESKERSVEYDPASADHLYITDYRMNGSKLEKTQFLFKGERFSLLKLGDYYTNKKLSQDGIQNKYFEDEKLEGQLIFKADKLQQQTFFYSNGNRQTSFYGDENTLNGEFKMWYEDGHLSFSGNYKNNLKEGEFESFDPSVNQNRKGIYKEGKLISGESVVQDLVYEMPDISAQPIGDDSTLNKYLKMKTADLPAVKEMAANIVKVLNLKLTIDKNGQTDKMDIISVATTADRVILNAIFKEFPYFQPALLEGAPVRSIRNLDLEISSQGLQIQHYKNKQTVVNDNDSLDDNAYSMVDEMPEFSGGEMALIKFLAKTVKYPSDATEKGKQGKVFVNFIVEKDGSIANITIVKGVYPSLDLESQRVIRSMPNWIPGRQKGKAVRVSYTIPINFILQ